MRGTDRLMMTLELIRCCKKKTKQKQMNDSSELMSHSDKLLRGYYGQMRCYDRLMRHSCRKVRTGACKHASGWQPKFSVTFCDGGTHDTHLVILVQRSLFKLILVYEAQISQNGIIPDLFGLTLFISGIFQS